MANAITKAKGSFFDKAAVIKAIGRANADALGKSGNKLKLIAQRSMRYVDPVKKSGKPRAVSRPGQPPKAVRNHPWLRKHLYNVFDFASQRAVIGPAKLTGQAGDVPKVLEHGGVARIINKRRRTRRIGSGGEVRIGLPAGRTTKLTSTALMGTIPVTYARLTTPGMVTRANRINEELYGPLARNKFIAARPYMGPALVKTGETMNKLWLNSVKA